MMYRCEDCNKVIGPGVPLNLIPTGFKKEGRNVDYGRRIGEKKVCSACALRYEDPSQVTTAEGFKSVHYAFINQS